MSFKLNGGQDPSHGRDRTAADIDPDADVAGSLVRDMTITMAAVTALGGLILVVGVILGSRHEINERGAGTGVGELVRELGGGLMVIDTAKAVGFTVLFVLGVITAVAATGWYYSRKEIAPIQRALRMQRDFVADASHELKTPIAVITTRVELIRFRQQRGEDISEPLDELSLDVDRMNAILSDLLAAARGAVQAHPVRLPSIVRSALDDIRPLADRADVDMDLTVEPDTQEYAVMGDETGIGRCFVAVLDNAIAHSPAGSRISVTVRRTDRLAAGRTDNLWHMWHLRHRQRMNPNVQVSISDQGPGISGDPERLFRRFAREDAGTGHQGYGLGFALARDAASRYGATLAVQSTGPQGTTMLLTFPMAQPQA